ncbi:MAG: hypothetical protein LBM61_08080 [Prevotellaceae bacterium]|jgi:hypothetical protein|nr:hypothetical protein [Prevotellaceae bacterium]
MTTELLISIIGAFVAVTVSIIGFILTNRSNIILQTRKLKEEHYFSFIEALHNLCAENNVTAYTSERDKLFLIASRGVISKLLEYEENGTGREQSVHDHYLTQLIKAIRKDLKLSNNRLPLLYFKKA